MDEQMIADIAKAIDDALPQRVCLADESLTFVATAAHSVIAGKVAELRDEAKQAADGLREVETNMAALLSVPGYNRVRDAIITLAKVAALKGTVDG